MVVTPDTTLPSNHRHISSLHSTRSLRASARISFRAPAITLRFFYSNQLIAKATPLSPHPPQEVTCLDSPGSQTLTGPRASMLPRGSHWLTNLPVLATQRRQILLSLLPQLPHVLLITQCGEDLRGIRVTPDTETEFKSWKTEGKKLENSVWSCKGILDYIMGLPCQHVLFMPNYHIGPLKFCIWLSGSH